ncbi:MAG TPA: zinc ABC transporter substrate-binding protein [Candidatus Thermoplasmatota archaeon]|nr:zinc ABC transporter substrate-binding protein [Candidatus Thermoplasmatota archaeon]
MTTTKKILIGILVAVFLLITAGATLYSTKIPAVPTRFTVVTTFYPLFYFTQQIAGDNVTVTMLIPDNVEPHTWEPTVSDIVTVSNAQVFVYNGGGFEPWVADVISSVQNKHLIVVDTSTHMNLTSEQGITDPHFWLDPLLAKTQVENIAAGLIQADPSHAATYTQNADHLASKLDALDRDYRIGLQNRTKNDIITTHEGFDYLAYRYGFVAHAAIGISADAQPSTQDMARLVQLVKTLDLHYVFVEPIFSDVFMDTIARETGAQVLVLDGIHGRTGAHAHMDYFQIMEENLRNLRIGLEVK